MKKTATWIVVCDHQHARVFATDGASGALQPIPEVALDTRLEASRDMMTTVLVRVSPAVTGDTACSRTSTHIGKPADNSSNGSRTSQRRD